MKAPMKPFLMIPSSTVIPCAALLAAVCLTAGASGAAPDARARSDGANQGVESDRSIGVVSGRAPHMDHEPKHGGTFFMAPDQHHHLEGVLEPSGIFRIYLYDAYTRPIPAARYRAVTQVHREGEKTTPLPLLEDRGDGTLWVRIPTTDQFPIDMSVWITFPARDGSPERTDLFSFSFDALPEPAHP